MGYLNPSEAFFLTCKNARGRFFYKYYYMTDIQNKEDLYGNSTDTDALINELSALRNDMIGNAANFSHYINEAHPVFKKSAENLLHYLALRRHDLRPLQNRLAQLGLSSLGHSEAHILASIDSVRKVLHRLKGENYDETLPDENIPDFYSGQQLLTDHTNTLLGTTPKDRNVRIMVTMPGEAANDYTLIEQLLRQGMDCMRINCAHDNAEAWKKMIDHLRQAEKVVGRTCKIAMDLGGPKLRTGPIAPLPPMVKIKPERNNIGRVISPSRIWLSDEDHPHLPPTAADAILHVPAIWLAHAKTGEKIKFIDSRDSKRTLTIADITPNGCWVTSKKTAYIIPGTVLHIGKKGGKHNHDAIIQNLPQNDNSITLKTGDSLIISRNLEPGKPATFDISGHLLTPATIGCTIPEVFNDVQSGHSIWFDDGKIGGVIEQVNETEVLVKITQARSTGKKLGSDKGINLPDSKLKLTALTEQDRLDLPFIAEFADIVELSFANSVKDVEMLQAELNKFGGRQPSIILKIETRTGFENLPAMLLSAMRMPVCGVMIGRGDLAIECGFERLAEVQEEILWFCEAAHVPAIWATQVLETLAKDGMPSRAEITDAAMGHRAECVMLNKGPHVLSAIRVLDDILRRMASHQDKKMSMLRELKLAHLKI